MMGIDKCNTRCHVSAFANGDSSKDVSTVRMRDWITVLDTLLKLGQYH